MTPKEKCQQSFARMRAAQVHATAIMSLPMNDMNAAMVQGCIDHLNDTYEAFVAARASHNCERYCIEQTLVDEDAMSCPALGDIEKFTSYIAMRRRQRIA